MPDHKLPYNLSWTGQGAAFPKATPAALQITDQFAVDGSPPVKGSNRLYWADNLPLMRALLSEFAEKIDLIYLDPPFNVGQEFSFASPLGEDRGMGKEAGASVRLPAYRDIWEDGSYLQTLDQRLRLARELLSPRGSIIIHVDWRVGHVVQVLMDEIFGSGERRGAGESGFRNEIVWGYGGGGHISNAYRRKHDNLFWYTKSRAWTFHPQYRPYTAGTQKRGLTAVKGPRYSLREEGAQLETWWTDPGVQKILSPTAAENWKYPTQKPESLLERILRGHSSPGDLVADFYCGSGTTGVVAERLGRRWLMADESRAAVLLARKRLAALQTNLASSGATYRTFDFYQAGAPDASRLRAGWTRHADGSWDIRLLCFDPDVPEDAGPEIRERAESAPFDLLDYWAVDWRSATDGVFDHQWRAFRTPSQRRLPLETDARRAEAGPVRVKAVDVWGNEWEATADQPG